MNVKNIFNSVMDDEFNTLKDLIKKEMNFIEGFKSVNTKESNPLYCQVCGDLTNRLNLALNTLKK